MIEATDPTVIAGWTHILRMEGATPVTIGRAAEVFDRTGLIKASTARRDC